MFRVAACLRERGIAPHATAGYLNYSEPRIDRSVADCIDVGARRIAIVPYFLVAGKFVRADVAQTLRRLRSNHAEIEIESTGHLGDHPLLAELARLRAKEALGRPLAAGDALVILAHGSPIEAANDDVRRTCDRLVAQGLDVTASYMERNAPGIEEAVATAASRATTIVAVPYFLQLGRHVRDDLPHIISALQRHHSTQTIKLAEHLGYHPWLADIVADRLRGRALPCPSD
jgi:sirohydrochlorin ferrochelatase